MEDAPFRFRTEAARFFELSPVLTSVPRRRAPAPCRAFIQKAATHPHREKAFQNAEKPYCKRKKCSLPHFLGVPRENTLIFREFTPL